MSAELISNIISQGQRLATHSWEYGTFAEALLEWYNPSSSVFGNNTFPDGKIPVLQVDSTQSLSYVKPHISTDSDTLVDGDGAAGDPASLGVSAILIGQTESDFLSAADRQVQHLLNSVPRWSNGAISHRESVAELWADFIYMAPPTLAYWAIQSDDEGLLNTAIQQCSLYQQVLGVPSDAQSAAGLWHHIVGPQSQDLGIWSTGNGWAAAGMSRVLATAKKSRFAGNGGTSGAITQLKNIIRSILDGAIARDNAEPNEPLLRNYLNDTTWFAELSGTTLLTATAYRMAQLEPADFGNNYISWADSKRQAITDKISSDGLLSPVINPLNWKDKTPATESPEAQSFAVLMFAAHRDFTSGH
ncbi:uncharacterized protein F4822DRAFT_443398 [Hypoxylon trugodes]|uniref:uncharacterized protein n=1 Tax=Hypoxylon trugodes TaxID=326681 RepID=UPI002192AB16|nr:uncharacterized protein F4822DRAFT_443398 [Hypoxylon trugodes]KAI1388368.1 hypothetical protein F4822DRAFT_443398 [Hypoxylon trugodes]